MVSVENLDDYSVDRLYSYVVAHDTGFAPNPFWGICTLACCKPRIRKTVGAQLSANPNLNIWVVGLTPKHGDDGNDIIYVMKVTEALSYADYFHQYPEKLPDFSRGDVVHKCGDNIYRPIDKLDVQYCQLRSAHSILPHSSNWKENPDSTEHDLKGEYVLIAKKFIYFGSSPMKLPKELQALRVMRGHRCNFTDKTLASFNAFICQYRKKIEAGTVLKNPHKWPVDEPWSSQI